MHGVQPGGVGARGPARSWVQLGGVSGGGGGGSSHLLNSSSE